MKRRGKWFGEYKVSPVDAVNNRVQWLVSAAKGRARQRGLPFDLSASDLIIPEVCPYLKTPFIPKTMSAMSLDRVIPEKGYVKGNVEIISRKANAMKSNATTQELLEFAYTILERH